MDRSLSARRAGSRLVGVTLISVLAASLLSVVVTPTAVADGAIPDGFTDELVRGGLNQPTAAVFAPNGRLFIGEKSGIVKTYDSISDVSPTTTTDLRPKVMDYWDRGLLGLAIDPQYPVRPYLYALYTYDALPGQTHPKWNDACPTPPGPNGDGCVVTGRLSRLTLDANGVATGAEQVLITDWCQQFPSHSIGTVTFGPDGALYVGGGDGASFTFADYGQRGNPCGDPPSAAGTSLSSPTSRGGALRSQSPRRPATEPRTLDGAIIRVNPDTGAAMPGNPFAGSSDANARRIIAYGMRNQFRFGFRPGTNELWAGDVGWGAWEEINRIPNASDGVAENFGWPCFEGAGRQAGYDGANLTLCESLYSGGGHTGPHYTYNHDASVVSGDGCPTGSSAISGLAFEEDSNYPAAYNGALFFADSSRMCIWAMQLGANGQPDPGKLVTLASGVSRPVQLLSGPGGNLYYVAFDSGELRRITYTSGNRAPKAVVTADPKSGPAPLTVRFDGSGSSDPDLGDTLRYAWDLDGDGAYDDSTAAKPEHTYVEVGLVRAGLKVTDQEGLSGTATVDIDVGAPANPYPVVAIDEPTSALTWRVGQQVSFSGRAADPQDGTLPASALSWQLTVQHCSSPDNCHAHAVQDYAGVSSGSFTAPDHGYPSYLDLRLTARDSDGNTASKTVRLEPKTVKLDFESSPAGLELTVGSAAQRAPFSRTGIVGSANSISTESPQDPGDYWFTGWSDSGARAHETTAPATPTTYRASFVTCTVNGVKVPDCGGAKPSAPRSVDAFGGRGKATVSWQHPHWPGVDGVTKYRVSVEGGKVYDNISPTATSQTVSGLGNKSQTFTVQAFSAAGAGPAVSTSLSGSRVASSTTPSTLTYGSSTTIKGVYTDTDTGAALPGLSIDMWARPKGWNTWTWRTRATTNTSGVVKFVSRTPRHYEYQLRFEGNSAYLGTTSAVRSVAVRHRVSASFADVTVAKGTTAKLSGYVAPRHAYQYVRLQRYSGGKWVTVSSKKLSSTSRYTFHIRWWTRGNYRYRVMKHSHYDHAAGYSPARYLYVR